MVPIYVLNCISKKNTKEQPSFYNFLSSCSTVFIGEMSKFLHMFGKWACMVSSKHPPNWLTDFPAPVSNTSRAVLVFHTVKDRWWLSGRPFKPHWVSQTYYNHTNMESEVEHKEWLHNNEVIACLTILLWACNKIDKKILILVIAGPRVNMHNNIEFQPFQMIRSIQLQR